MENTALPGFIKYFSKRAIATYFIVMLAVSTLFITHVMPLLWFCFSSLSVVLFFSSLHKLLKFWGKYDEKEFKKKVFRQAFLIRAVGVVFLYFFFQIVYGIPYEFEAGDAIFYDTIGRDLSSFMLKGDFNLGYWLRMLEYSDRGFPIYQGFIFLFVFQSILLSRLVNAALGAWSCILIYDLTKRNFGEATARIASILMMLLPNFIYYSGLSLKETLMVFSVLAYVNAADKTLRARRLVYKDLLVITITGGALFFFRTALGACMVLTLLTSIVVTSSRVTKFARRAFLMFWVCLGGATILSTTLGDTISKLISESETNQESQLQNFSTRKGGNSLAKYGSFSVFLPMILVAPFPTLVDTNQQNQMMLSGGFFIRNMYAFFVILALVTLYKRGLLRKHALIIITFSSYLLVLASSGFALSERFHLPIVPYLLIMAAYGITQVNFRNLKYITPYIVFVSLVIIGWNWFKLSGRGL